MEKKARHWLRLSVGILTLIPFLIYLLSIVSGKYPEINQIYSFRLTGFGEFLMLLIATGGFMVFAGTSPKSNE